MGTTEQEVLRRRKDDRILEILAGGSLTKAVGGAAAVVLCILGLARVYPGIALSVATIAVGVALLFEGGAIAARYSRLLPRAGEGYDTVELGGGMTTEFIGGAAGIILGILTLLQVVPTVLTATAAIVFGGALLLGNSVPSRLNAAMQSGELDEQTRRHLREAASTATGTNVLVGLAGVVLGILSLVGVGPTQVLSLVAILAIGFTVLLSGTAVSGKMMSLIRR